MLTRETALERLRTTGTLAVATRSKHAITLEQAKDPMAHQIGRIVEANLRGPRERCLAPSANHAVLP